MSLETFLPVRIHEHWELLARMIHRDESVCKQSDIRPGWISISPNLVGKDRAETNDPSHSLRESKSTLISSGTRMRNFLFRENVSDGFPEIDDDEKAPTLTWILNDYASREVDGNRQRWSCASPSSSSDSNWITHHRRCSFVLHILREGRPFPPFLLCQLCKIHHGWKEIVKRMSISVACRKKRRWIENSLLPAYNPPTLLNH